MKKYLHILMPTEKIKYKTGTWKGRSDNIQKYIKYINYLSYQLVIIYCTSEKILKEVLILCLEIVEL